MRIQSFIFIMTLGYLVACNLQGEATSATIQPDTSSGHFLAVPLDTNLVDTAWRLIELNGEPFPEEMKLTMFFTADGIEGHTGCNKWLSAGALTVNDSIFSVSQIASETGECARTDLEKGFVHAITEATIYFLQRDMLFIQSDDSGKSLTFRPLKN